MADTITLSTCLYEGREQIRNTFPYSYRAKECIKAFPGARWSPDNRFCYLKDPAALPSLSAHRPERYFAEGRPGQPYSPTSVRNILKHNARRAGIIKPISPHTLRHSYATHLL